MRPGRRETVPLLLILVLGAFLLAGSWNRWLEPVVDTGRDLSIPERIASGEVKLYRDVLYNYPPLTPYLLAAVVRAAGSSLAVYSAIGIATAAATALLLYLLGRMLTGNILGAAIAPLFFLARNFTSAVSLGANYVFPYSHAATFGMLFLLAFLAGLVAWGWVRRRPAYLGAALLFGLLAFWTKIEYAACVLATLAAAALLQRLPWRWLAGFAGSLVLSSAFVWWWFSDAPPDRHWLFGNILRGSLIAGDASQAFFAKVFGTVGLANIAGILGGAVLVALLAGAVHLFESLGGLSDWTPGQRAAARTVIVAGALGISVLLATQFLLLRAWTLLQPALLIWALLRDRRSPLPLLLVFSMSSSLRVALNLVPEWYGFVYTVPLYLVIAYTLFRTLPEKGVYTVRSSVLLLPLVALFVLFGVAFHSRIYEIDRVRVASRRGVFHDPNTDRGRVLNEFLREMASRRDVRSMVVFPEGLTLNYLTGIPNPTAFYIFTPAEIGNPAAERLALEELKAKRPRLAVLLTRDLREYGSRGFGIDYAKEIALHLRSSYRPGRRWRSKNFSLTILELADPPAADRAGDTAVPLR